LPKFRENVTLINLKYEINGIISERLEGNKSDIADINSLINAAGTVITGKMI
jgi:hypothetical protein